MKEEFIQFKDKLGNDCVVNTRHVILVFRTSPLERDESRICFMGGQAIITSNVAQEIQRQLTLKAVVM